jgi:hypothetical protein
MVQYETEVTEDEEEDVSSYWMTLREINKGKSIQ